MNAMQLLTGSIAQAIGWALLHLLWQATVVAGILAATLQLLPRRNATTRYAAACGALALVFGLFVATAIRAYDPAATPIATAPAASTTESVTVPLSQIPMVIVTTATEGWRDRAMDAVTRARQSLPSVVAIWFVGVVFLSSRLLISFIRVRRMATHGVREASAEWQRVAARLSENLGLRRAVQLLESAAVEVPSVLGSLRPVILLPASTLTGMTPQQIEMVLAHELAHIRRHDFAINLLQAFVETLMFYHPAVWWMSSRVRIERENCCDDLAVAVCGNPLQYARALTRLEELRSTSTLAVAANGGSLLDRIRRIAGARAESTGVSSRWAAAVAMLAILAIAMIVPSVPALAQRDENPPQAAKATVDVVEAHADEDMDPADKYEHDYAVHGVAVDVDMHPDVDVDVDADVDVDSDMDFDFDSDLFTPVPPVPPVAMVPPVPMVGVTPAPRAMLAPMAMPAVPPVPPAPAPRAPRALASLSALDAMEHAHAFAYEYEYEGDDDEDEDEDRHADRKLSADGKLSVDELISLRAVGVTPEYINEMRALFPDLTVRQVSGMRAVGVTPKFISEMRSSGLKVTNARQAQSLAAVGVTPKFISDMRAAGLKVDTEREATSLRAVGVTPEFIREMRDAGIEVKDAHDATSLRAVGVTPGFIRDMRSAGFAVTTEREATNLRAVGVTPEFIREMRSAGFEVKSAKDASSLRAVGVTAGYIRELRDAGVEIKTARDATSLRAVGVTAEFVKKLANAGYKNLSVRELSRLAASGIDDDFIREMEQYRSKN